MNNRKRGQIGPRIFVYLMGLLIMSLGIVLLIKADLGVTPWDVLHVGMYYQLGLTIGSWSIIVGILIITVAAFISKEFPHVGTFSNMILVGLFIDMYYLLPFLQTPETLTGKLVMFVVGIIINGYGMGVYLSAQFGAGPRDSLMIALSTRVGWKVRNVRAVMEVLVLFIGWQLGGPVFWGTIVYSLVVGPLVGYTIPQSQLLTDKWLYKLNEKKLESLNQSHTESNRGVNL